MDPNSNTKNVSKPGQAQSPELPESARQAEEPDNMKIESPRKCKVCGGPDHRGCGCEAKQLRKAKEAGLTENEAKALHEPETPAAGHRRTVGMVESEAPAAVPESLKDTVDLPKTETDDDLDDILSAEALREAHDANMNMAKNIGIMTERSGAICDCLCDLCQYFKVISEDLKTIKEVLIKKDEVKKNAT